MPDALGLVATHQYTPQLVKCTGTTCIGLQNIQPRLSNTQTVFDAATGPRLFSVQPLHGAVPGPYGPFILSIMHASRWLQV